MTAAVTKGLLFFPWPRTSNGTVIIIIVFEITIFTTFITIPITTTTSTTTIIGLLRAVYNLESAIAPQIQNLLFPRLPQALHVDEGLSWTDQLLGLYRV